MPSSWKNAVNQSFGTVRININNFVLGQPLVEKSPIDIFYEKTRPVVTMASPTLFHNNDWIGAYLLIAIISETENYFRGILSKVIKICFISQKNAANHNINFGSVIWHPSDEVERGAFEGFSFASSDNIISNTKKYVGIDIKNDLNDILGEFDKLCELRHGIVHAGRVLAGKNAIKLGLPSRNDNSMVIVQYPELQAAIDVCTTLVTSYNKHLFCAMAKRWAEDWRSMPAWSPSKENEYFKSIWKIFRSVNDETSGTITFPGTWIKCKNEVKKAFDI